MRIDIITLFPDFFVSPLKTGVLKRAIDAGIVYIHVVDIRRFTVTKHRIADDYPFGGGAGMVMKPEPIMRAIRHLGKGGLRPRTVLLTPQGRTFDQKTALRLSKYYRLAFLCGRYEGVDERVVARYVDEEISIGDYILSGGETAALVVIEALARLLPGVVGNTESVDTDTFSGSFLKYPQYTRPQEYLGMPVPEVLLSGNHKSIDEWRKRRAAERTIERRPDLLDDDTLTDEEKKIIARISRRPGGDTKR
ncbi:MAG: tRNA (guanosine(37)-N1)-methyltransferase TrmD [Deltaproteobacteria bacterium]|nr:tRNA (guanosine(37)-N1)-methyltransferase TrmD [Candidatus Zymogenaceae bacterium]